MNTADMTSRVLADIRDGLVYRIPGVDGLPDSYRLDDNTQVHRGEYAYYLDALRRVSTAGLVEARQNGWLEDGDQYLAGGRRQRVTPAGRLRMASTSTLVGVA